MHRRAEVLALCLATGCASSGAPAGFLKEAPEAQRIARGGWACVKLKYGPPEAGPVCGELLAAGRDGIVLDELAGAASDGAPPRVRRLRRDEIDEIRVTGYENREGGLGLWGTAGVLSTLSHGFWLVLSAPIWLIAAISTAAAESRAAMVDHPPSILEAFSLWARFPQGEPEAPPRDIEASPPLRP